MKRRQILQAAAALPVTFASKDVFAQDKWGQGQGYPAGIQTSFKEGLHNPRRSES